MINKVVTSSFIVVVSVLLSACSDGVRGIQQLLNAHSPAQAPTFGESGLSVQVTGQVESAADKLFANSFAMLNKIGSPTESDAQSCGMDDTAVVTIYSTNGRAQSEIDVKLDGSHIGSLTTYFPDDEPGCKAPTAEGIITITIPSGKHTLEAFSPNLNWPSHVFSVKKCECMSLPLS